ncbi:hypothetical protein G5V58_06810 [Nocardioides anomalus]|uniref:Glycosyltransferase RgtA/B/C/D-like domain-containing protein n=1 Tax=Nocardioides anomalus TaxID=2712223 RepID=A0A6G6WBB2_9ACTN|nr:hypothetical protein [Nocardioides anomalus]QIG42522.1 hypothetical protein G5V58_06810 [Nocardioides anomalus]
MTTTAPGPIPTDTPGPPDAGATTRAPETGTSPVTFVARTVVPAAMFLATLVVMVRTAAAPLSNPDTFFHLRFGREFLEGWSLRSPGHVTSWATADWVPTQWLPQEVMAQFDQWFGLPGVAWLAGLQFVGLALTFYLAARRWADRVVTAPLVVVALLACAPSISMRPQVLSYLATTLVTALWLAVRAGSRRSPWWLVPLLWVWAMCHGMWPLGVIVSAVAVLGLVLDGVVRGRRALLLGAVPVVAGLAGGLLTPVGAKLLPAVLLVNSRGQYFSEWKPPDFTMPNCLALLLLLLVTVLVMVKRSADWTTILLVGLAAGFAVYSARTVPVAAALLVPVAAAQLQRVVGPVRRQRRRERLFAVGSSVTALVVLALLVPTTSDHTPPQPEWVDGAFASMPAGTRILDESVFGGFLMYRYPDLDFMFSGYGDIYTTHELETMSKINDLQPGWDDMIRDAQPAYAFLDPETPLGYALVHSEGWTVVEDSEDVQLLAPPPGWMSDSD